MRVRYDDAGVYCKGFASHDPFRHAAPHHDLEQLAQEIALAEAAVAVLGEGRMIWNVAVEPQPTKPPIGQIKMDLLAQPSLRANAEIVADDEHSDHQLRINRGPADVAVVGPQVCATLGQVDEPVDLAQDMIVGHMPLEAEAVEQRLLHHPPLAHHRPNLLHLAEGNQRPAPRSSRVFQHRVMGGSSSAKADTIGQDVEEETVQWTILLASISQWMRRMFAFSIAKVWWFARARPSRRRRRLPANWPKRRVAAASCSRRGAWRRSCFPGWANSVFPWSASRAGRPTSRSSHWRPTRPIATTREV